MENVNELKLAKQPSWSVTLINLLPLWLMAIAITAEGFPRPPIPIGLAISSFVISIAAGIFLVLKRRMGIKLFLYSLLPYWWIGIFDEISTTYKTPFIILCTLILSAGAIGYQHIRSTPLRWLILLSAAVLTWVAASHAAFSFWNMASALGYVQCFPDYTGCAPLTGQEPSWLALFFGF